MDKKPIKVFYPERQREKPIQIVFNPELDENSTPARIFTELGVIEIGKKFLPLPPQQKMFILLHEYGHLFYKDEHKTDIYALKNYLQLGFNPSQAFRALSEVLHRSPENLKRIEGLFKAMKTGGYVN